MRVTEQGSKSRGCGAAGSVGEEKTSEERVNLSRKKHSSFNGLNRLFPSGV